ncbi:MAG: hypothetical protein K9M10_01910 [Candidatus Pacebacteria bacterium]|nr:hypothetical protein [Candidatus Paceibacterota bacterium]MCF7857219.1 hypothetical protein [Candidatus Paceibacterota bacterium]
MVVKAKKGPAVRAITKTVPTRAKKTRKKESTASVKIDVAKVKTKKKINVKLLKSTQNPKIVITDNSVKKSKEKLITKAQLQIVCLSPYRFPSLNTKTVALAARIAGVFFVLAGTFFSLLNLQYIVDPEVTTESRMSGANYTRTAQQANFIGIIDTSRILNTETQPAVRLSPGTGTPFANVVPVTVSVGNASEVKLIAERKKDGRLIPVGSAVRIDNNNWKSLWDTRQYDNGEYNLRTVIKNLHGSYEQIDSAIYSVANKLPEIISPREEPKDENGIMDNTNQDKINSELVKITDDSIEKIATTTQNYDDGGTKQVENDEPLMVPEINEHKDQVLLILPNDRYLSNSILLKILANEASEIKVYARGEKTRTPYFVGSATRSDTDYWHLTWNTKKVPNGRFEITAHAVVNNESRQSLLKTVIVKNEIEALSPVVTLTEIVKPEEKYVQKVSSSTDFLKPSVGIDFSKKSPFSGYVDIIVTAPRVDSVEIFAKPRSSLTAQFLGLARRVSSSEWKYTWITKESPNGDYDVYARVKSPYGFIEGSKSQVTVHNELMSTFTPEQELKIETLTKADDSLISFKDESQAKVASEIISVTNNDQSAPPKVVYVQAVNSFINSVEADDEIKSEIQTILTDYRSSLHSKLNDLAKAERSGSENERQRVKESIKEIQQDALRNFNQEDERKSVANDVNSYISQVTAQLEEVTIKNEAILKERIGDAVILDSDKDEISDYDEVNLYNTNPFSADTDGDGFTDGSEIARGYNPHDSSSEALVVYESPKDSGITREDLLVVESITALSDNVDLTGLETPKRAIISGRALPNSFVTLYIYSTPIVVTVRTDSDGGWSYILDKELENGTHEVYAGITDNAGYVVARSNPLPFVKTAEAYTNAAVTEKITVQADPSFFRTNALFAIASIAIAAIGLVLLLLGLHVREEESVLARL